MGSPRTVNRFISAPVQPSSTPGTGGGTGGGVTATQYDRYIGTLGTPENAPSVLKKEFSLGTSAIAPLADPNASSIASITTAGSVSISGRPLQGQVLTASLSVTTGLVGAITYQWEQSTNGTTWAAITGATNRTITLAQAQVGLQVRAALTYRTTTGASKFPNFTTFPAAEKRDWVRITTSSTIDGIPVREGEEWVCNEKTAANDASKWELKAAAIPYSQLSRLDTSQYIGSLGLAKDAPTNAPAPHFTQFPAANKGDWIQIVSSFRANDLNLMSNVLVQAGETWICKADGTEAENPDNWDRLMLRPRMETVEEVGFYFLSRYDFFSVPTDVKTVVDFNLLSTTQIVRAYYIGTANEIFTSGNFINITPWKNYAARNNVDVYLDIECSAYFEADANGDRNVSLIYSAATLRNNVYDYAASLYLDSQTNLPARAAETTAKIKVKRFKIDWITPKNPSDILIHALSVEILQTSGIPLPVRRCTITLSLSKDYSNA